MEFLLSWQGLALVLPVIATLVAHLVQSTKANIAEQLLDPHDRIELRLSLQNTGPVEAYRTAVEFYFLKPVERFFGAIWSKRSFIRCLNIALVYPTAILVVAWAAGAECSFGRNTCPIPIDIPNGPERWFRGGLILICFITSFVCGFFLARREERITKFILAWLPVSSHKIEDPESGPRFLLKMLILIIGIAFISNILLVILVKPAFSYIPGTIAAGLFGARLCTAAGMAFADNDNWWLPLFIAVTLTMQQLWLDNHSGAIIGFVLILALPFINGFIDWLSLGFTRKLMTYGITSQVRRGIAAIVTICARTLIDIVVALVTMIMLVVATTITVEAFNKWIVIGIFQREPIDIWYLIDAARYDPYSIGLLVTFTLATTLLPTLAHLVAGLTGIGFALSPSAKIAARLIPESQEEHFSAAARQKVTRILIWRLIWILPAITVSLSILFGILAFANYAIEPIGLLLADIAYCSTSWSHGICPAPDNLPYPKLTPFSIDD